MCTGLEPVFLGMGASASTAATLATASGMFAASKVAGSLLKPSMPNMPAPEKPPQAPKAPDRPAIGRANAAAFGNSSTFLTGPLGVDPSQLSLGRNKLLGE